MIDNGVVFIVDDDCAFADALALLVRSMGYQTSVSPSADEFLQKFDPAAPGCLLLDVRMPQSSGLALQEHLAQLPLAPPVVIMTGHAEVPTALRAMRHGAVDFLEKPFSETQLYETIQKSLIEDAKRRAAHAERESIAARFSRLKAAELKVLDLVVQGLPNKLIAKSLGVSQRTVEDRRARLMKKLQVETFADLVRVSLERDATTRSG